MSSKKRLIKISAFIVAFGMLFGNLTTYASNSEVKLEESRNKLEEVESNLNGSYQESNLYQEQVELQQQELSSVEEVLNSLNNKKMGYEDKINILRAEIQRSMELVYELNEQVIQVGSEISEKENKVKELKRNISKNIKALRNRLRVMYKMGEAKKLEILFSSSDINDFLSREKMMTTITEYDQKLIETLNQQKKELSKMISELNGKKKSLEIAQQNAEEERSELELKKQAQEILLARIQKQENEKYKILSKVNSKLEEYQSYLDKKLGEQSRLAEEKDRLNSEIAELESKIAEEEAESQYDDSSAESQYDDSSEESSEQDENLDALEEKRKELADISEEYRKHTSQNTKLLWPSDATYITYYFGDPSYPYGEFHYGIDIAGETGTPLYAAEAGVVVDAEYNEYGYGNMVTIDHGNGLMTRYGHMNTLPVVKVGDRVYRGQYIGPMGNTGYSFGSHVHFEVIVNGQRVDPLPYIR